MLVSGGGRLREWNEDSNIAVEKKKREGNMIEREQNIVLKIRKRW